MVPTVERGFLLVDFWSIDTAGDSPSMKSTSGLSICPRNWRAYADSDSTYRRWPSAKMVSNASEDLPDPDRPVKTTRASRGRSRETSFRLCSRAPRTISRSFTEDMLGAPTDSLCRTPKTGAGMARYGHDLHRGGEPGRPQRRP